MNRKVGSGGGRRADPTKMRLLDFLTGQEAGSTGRDYELKPQKSLQHILSGSA
jgi:hypothetical protein